MVFQLAYGSSPLLIYARTRTSLQPVRGHLSTPGEPLASRSLLRPWEGSGSRRAHRAGVRQIPAAASPTVGHSPPGTSQLGSREGLLERSKYLSLTPGLAPALSVWSQLHVTWGAVPGPETPGPLWSEPRPSVSLSLASSHCFKRPRIPHGSERPRTGISWYPPAPTQALLNQVSRALPAPAPPPRPVICKQAAPGRQPSLQLPYSPRGLPTRAVTPEPSSTPRSGQEAAP